MVAARSPPLEASIRSLLLDITVPAARAPDEWGFHRPQRLAEASAAEGARSTPVPRQSSRSARAHGCLEHTLGGQTPFVRLSAVATEPRNRAHQPTLRL